jgi:LPXTG-site transpeptidase (sortase) family protein
MGGLRMMRRHHHRASDVSAGGPVRRLGTALVFVGLVVLMLVVAWDAGLLPGSRVEIPSPAPTAPRPAATLAATSVSAVRVQPTAEPPAVVSAPPAVRTAPLVAADAAERREAAASPRPGPAVRLAIDRIGLETDVVQAGVVQRDSGEYEWETVPFVAAHYGGLTAMIGAPGNALIAGHVVTRNEGNVFRDLNQAQLGDRVEVLTEAAEFVYEVDDVQLVTPDRVEVLAPGESPRLTLLTCGGSFDPIARAFSHRLIVSGHLVSAGRLGA